MSFTKKAIFCWSGGKDSAYCLDKILSEKEYNVAYLLTTLNKEHHRISMHGVKEALLETQAASIGIPLIKTYVSEATNEEYERIMLLTLSAINDKEDISHIIFGDIFLEDLRAYRENMYAKIGLTCIFPLWGMDTAVLIQKFMQKGFKTITCCVSNQFLNKAFVGKEIDENFIQQLPKDVDPCGENGEFHTFCYDGPIFKHPINISIGEIVFRPLELNTTDNKSAQIGFWFCDLT